MHRIRVAAALAAVALLAGCAQTQEAPEPVETTEETIESSPEVEPDRTVTIGSIGDILVHSDVYTTANAAANYEGYDFSAMFDPMRQYLEDADITTANMEVPVAGPEFGLSGYPQFNAPPEVIDGLLGAGVDVVNNATNHTMDRGAGGR